EGGLEVEMSRFRVREEGYGHLVLQPARPGLTSDQFQVRGRGIQNVIFRPTHRHHRQFFIFDKSFFCSGAVPRLLVNAPLPIPVGTNAIWLPSGDQMGLEFSWEGSRVNREDLPVDSSMTHTSPPAPSCLWIARYFPSGDRSGHR